MSAKHNGLAYFTGTSIDKENNFIASPPVQLHLLLLLGKKERKRERERERKIYPSSYFHTLHVGWSLSWAASM
jgi:hypothetical protein